MLLPLNLKTSKSVALSIIKINQFYSIKPCTIVNGYCNIGYPIKYCPVCGAKLE